MKTRPGNRQPTSGKAEAPVPPPPGRPLPPELLYTRCDPAGFKFKTTRSLEPLDDVIGQDRAVQAVRFAVGMKHKGFNLFALGPEGTGKSSLIRRFLVSEAAGEPVPDDWCYVNNFEQPHRPRAFRLPPGRGRHLRRDMERLVDDLGGAIPAAFESDEYRTRKSVIEEQFKEKHEETFSALQKRAQEKDVALIRTPVGLAVAPVREGEVLNSQEFENLPADDKKRLRAALEGLQKELEGILQLTPSWEKAQREQIRELNREVTRYVVGHLIDEMKKEWEALAPVLEFLEAVRSDVIDNADDFLPKEPQGEQHPVSAGPQRPFSKQSAFQRYRINVVVDNGGPEGEGKEGRVGSPVVYEDHPTQPNLLGRIEHMSHFGTLFTDFNLIKGGALHQANGGYLILDARKVLMQPFAWESLTRALRSRRIRVEAPAEALGWVSTVTLEPEPIPLEVKVVLMGEPWLYYLLTYYDPDFRELFKVAADFDSQTDRTPDAAHQYARMLAGLAEKEKLHHLDRTGVARVIEHASRLAEDAMKLSTHMGSIVDLVREADFWAREARAPTISGAHVQKAIEANAYRSDRLRQRIQEEIERHTLVIETTGERVGEINGLAVIQLDHFSFGKPSRISCQVRLGKGEVVDIEREVALGGPLHSKGVMILSSFLTARYARERPLTLSAHLTFEQSYGGVDGDSASSAELYALLSALAGIPLRQSLAVTGSIDQNGRVQAIGGVNEKIEGFFDVCNARGLTGSQGVLIPAANVKHLMLRHDVVAAAGAGRFAIFAVETVDQGIEILTGIPAGEPDERGEYPIGSVNRAVAHRLDHLVQVARSQMLDTRMARGGNHNGGGRS